MDHDSYVVLPILSPSSTPSPSSRSRFPSAVDDGLWTIRKSKSSVCTRKFVTPFYEYFLLFFESFHVYFCGFWFLQIFTICDHQSPDQPHPHVASSLKIFFSAFSFRTVGFLTCPSRYWRCTHPMFRMEVIVREKSYHLSTRMLSCHRSCCRARCASFSIAQSHLSSDSPLCTSAIAVPSLNLGTAHPATPFVSERWWCACAMILL